jgi:uncharacterized protein YjdB
MHHLKQMPPRSLPAFVALLAITCARSTAEPDPSIVASVALVPPTATVAVGSSIPMLATVLDEDGNLVDDRSIHWSVEDPSILTISSLGLATGLRLGRTQIAASAGGQSAIAEVTVVPVAAVTLRVRPDHVGLRPGQRAQLVVELVDDVGNILAGRAVTWSSNDPGVATVNGNGLVTAGGIGGAIITAKADGKTAQAAVTVSWR